MSTTYSIGIDIGGTFTDLAIAGSDGTAAVLKVPSNRQTPEAGVHEAISAAALSLGVSAGDLLARTKVFVHGTTIATNAVIEKDGAGVGLICSDGFRDVLAMRDGFKPERYNLHMPKPDPFVPRVLRVGVGGRIDYRGEEVTPLSREDVERALEVFAAYGVRSIAVSLLWSIVNPAHEQAVAAIVTELDPDMSVVCSSDLMPELGEFKRTSATVLSAYIKPRIGTYLRELERSLSDGGLERRLLVMQVNGGSATVDQIVKRPIVALHSGPAAAPAAARRVAERLGVRDVIAVDMGGTSFDVALLTEGEASVTSDLEVAGMPVGVQALDIASIGAGGGSVAWIDDGNALRVGPRSAGARPGPACYQKGGTEPTVTDADVVLGYLHEGNPLGGNLRLDADLAREAIRTHVADRLGLSVTDAARAIYEVVNHNMVEAIRLMSVKRGLDPRTYALIVGGGAGPVHGAALARLLEIGTVIVPEEAGAFCAMGMIAADVRHDYVKAVELSSDAPGFVDALAEVYAELEEKALADLREEGFPDGAISFSRTADARYRNQFHDIVTRVPGGELGHGSLGEFLDGFHDLHRRLYTYSLPDAVVDVFHCRVAGFAAVDTHPQDAAGHGAPAGEVEPHGVRDILFPGAEDFEPTPVYRWESLTGEVAIDGPTVIDRETTTVVVLPGQRVDVKPGRGLVIVDRSLAHAGGPAGALEESRLLST